MSILSQNLPLQIQPLHKNPEGYRYSAILQSLGDADICLLLEESALQQVESGSSLLIEFTMGKYHFRFESAVVQISGSREIIIRKPREIRKSTIRSSKRVSCQFPVNYNIWTQKGLYTGQLIDMSSVGFRMLVRSPLARNTLLGITIAVPGKALRFMCQGIVRWCRPEADTEGEYSCGVLFTTLSNEARQRLEKYIDEEIKRHTLL